MNATAKGTIHYRFSEADAYERNVPFQEIPDMKSDPGKIPPETNGHKTTFIAIILGTVSGLILITIILLTRHWNRNGN